MKILLLTDIHIGTSRESTTHPGIIRQANSEAATELHHLIPTFNERKYDLIVQMGDFIREVEDESRNLEIFNQFADIFKFFTSPPLHILGNHDLLAFPLEKLTEIFQSKQLSTNFKGVQDVGEYQIVWLDVALDENELGYLPQDTLTWLDGQVDSNKPTIIIGHYSIVPHDVKGNFLFSNKPQAAHYKNSEEIMKILERKNVKVALSGHAHWTGVKQYKNIAFVSVPSFSEHIITDEKVDQSPAVYAELELSNDVIKVKAYSGDFCFFNFECN